jgi:hypothetical protein
MVTKAKKPIRKKSSGTVRDLTARKDPKGGAQKKEGPFDSNNRDGTLRPGKPT